MLSSRKIVPAFLLLAAVATSAHAQGHGIRWEPPPSDEPPVAMTYTEVRGALAKRRALQLQRLRDYKNARLFPRNRVSDDVINVFMDEDGLLCAVANLINLDGELELVAKTAKDDNYVKMGNLKSGALLDWILMSGFTKEEIAAIQLPDSPVTRGRDWFEQENARIIAHLEKVEKQLLENTDEALDAATLRFMLGDNADFGKLLSLSDLKK